MVVISPVSNEVIASAAAAVTAYPSPATDYLYVKSNAAVSKYEVYSLAGALLLQSDKDTERIAVSALPSGIYLLKVYTDKGVSVIRFVKK